MRFDAVLRMWNRKGNDLLRFWFRLGSCSGSGSGSKSRQNSAQFSNNKHMVQNHAFSMSEKLFPRKLASHFEFFKIFSLLHLILDPDPNPVPEPDPKPEP